MTRPDLLARWAEELEDNVAAIVELTHAADAVIADQFSPMPHADFEALETLSHAIRHLTSLPLAVSRILSKDARRNYSSAGRELYRSELRLELARASDEVM